MASVPAINLTFDEMVPFYAGHRAASQGKITDWETPPTVEDVSRFLSGAERIALVNSDNQRWLMWFAIGIMHWHLEQTIAAARRP